MTAKVINRYRFNAGIAVFTLYANDENLIGVEVDHSSQLKLDEVYLTKSNKIIDETIDQIVEYVNGERKEFELPLLDESVGFEKEVLNALKDVQYGETITYSELGKKAGKKDASRAVGNVLSNNNFPVIIPCHRVIKSDGKPGNYIGGKELKEKLLDLEKNNK